LTIYGIRFAPPIFEVSMLQFDTRRVLRIENMRTGMMQNGEDRVSVFGIDWLGH
jgi:hypothetical protein